MVVALVDPADVGMIQIFHDTHLARIQALRSHKSRPLVGSSPASRHPASWLSSPPPHDPRTAGRWLRRPSRIHLDPASVSIMYHGFTMDLQWIYIDLQPIRCSFWKSYRSKMSSSTSGHGPKGSSSSSRPSDVVRDERLEVQRRRDQRLRARGAWDSRERQQGASGAGL